jgi:hypothetical protein
MIIRVSFLGLDAITRHMDESVYERRTVAETLGLGITQVSFVECIEKVCNKG